MISGDYDKALASLTESQGVHADKTTVFTITECRQARTHPFYDLLYWR